MAMNQIIVRWTLPGGAEDVLNIFHADESGGIAQQRAALADLTDELMGATASGVIATIETNGRIVNQATGLTTGFWSDPTPHVTTPNPSGGQAVGNASSVLIRWDTDSSTSSRRIQGRSFIPGMTAAALVDGGVAANVQAAYAAAAQDLVAADVGFGVFSRPSPNGAGALSLYTGASVWSELATQRRRRA